jgi:hypothetical protein
VEEVEWSTSASARVSVFGDSIRSTCGLRKVIRGVIDATKNTCLPRIEEMNLKCKGRLEISDTSKVGFEVVKSVHASHWSFYLRTIDCRIQMTGTDGYHVTAEEDSLGWPWGEHSLHTSSPDRGVRSREICFTYIHSLLGGK